MVGPTLERYCHECHGGAKTKGGVNLKALSADPQVAAESGLWEKVFDTVESGEMPPPKAKALPAPESRALLAWVTAALDAIGEPGDPGQVTLRRLTHAEYDFTIRDLTGHAYGFSSEFQSDGGGGEGFSNTGDVLFLSPRQLDQYFGAARQIADRATILPGSGIRFHPQRIGLRGPEQWKAQAQQALYVWYQQKAAPHLPKDFEDKREADYMLACWKHHHGQRPLAELARESGLRLPFLQNWWNLLNGVEPPSRFLDLTRVAWRELPGPDPAAPGKPPAAVVEKIKAIQQDLLSWNDPKRPGWGVQRRQQDSDGIRPYPMQLEVKGQKQVRLCIGDTGDGPAGDIALITAIEVRAGKEVLNYFAWLDRQIAQDRKSLSAAPAPPDADQTRKRLAQLEQVRGAFGKHPHAGRTLEPHVLALAAPQVFTLPLPDNAWRVRADTRLDLQNPEADKATIQWTLTTGAPPEVGKILPGVLTVWKIQTETARRTMADFNVMRAAFPDAHERLLEQVAGNLYRNTPNHTVYYFSDAQLAEMLSEREREELKAMKKDWMFTAPGRMDDKQKKAWDEAVRPQLGLFAARAWRRPLGREEAADLEVLYQRGVAAGMDRESAAREVLVRVLVSPNFLYKPEPRPAETVAAPGIDGPLSAWELASRLSYFLWSSMPDRELREAASGGSLTKPEVLAAQARRMLRDQRVEALAQEFAGQWLGFKGFEGADSVDQRKFPEFTAGLRADFAREPMIFFSKLFREDRPVGDITGGAYTFLNERLAHHYGVPGVTGPEFREVNVADRHRGGVLGMGCILTKTSRPNRTSPVLRGDYLYHVILGQSSPPPPPNVPKLPENAVKPASLREALEAHRADQACSVCHDRIDPLGFALESFDPIGRFRAMDEAGDKIDDTGRLRDGTELAGIDGLRQYLQEHQSEVREQFCRKLLGYALGRRVLTTDKALLAEMQSALDAQGGKVSAAVVTVVQSRQFRNARREPTGVASHSSIIPTRP
ncbi:MAG: DUF1592 domain-containing protein [Verrucomicrobia bacterium]|nr:DUF1592 domain-containing protein [Verrucomicrobiota bacterium]